MPVNTETAADWSRKSALTGESKLHGRDGGNYSFIIVGVMKIMSSESFSNVLFFLKSHPRMGILDRNGTPASVSPAFLVMIPPSTTVSPSFTTTSPLAFRAAIVGILGLYAVYYNIRQASVRKPRTGAA